MHSYSTTILDSLFTGIANTKSSVIGVEDGGLVGSHEVQTKAISTLKTVKWCPLVSFSTPHITQKAVMAKLT